MLTGSSVLHVNQDIGKCFQTDHLAGYYNNLTEKVTMQPELLDGDLLPQIATPDNKSIYFPVAVFQYGLGAYDLYIQTHNEKYLTKFQQCVEWTLTQQEEAGSWKNFSHETPEYPYGAMAQGEGASLLLRNYVMTGDNRCLEAAKRAIDFMLLSVEQGGTTMYLGKDVILLEYTNKPAVMNGWIFAWWGLYDYVLVTEERGHYRTILNESLQALENRLSLFDKHYWSMYDLNGHIASPFYHHLHIAQMQAMYQLTGHTVFNDYSRHWDHCEKNRIYKLRAFLVKAWQKICE